MSNAISCLVNRPPTLVALPRSLPSVLPRSYPEARYFLLRPDLVIRSVIRFCRRDVKNRITNVVILRVLAAKGPLTSWRSLVQVQYRPLSNPAKHSVLRGFFVIRFRPNSGDSIGDTIFSKICQLQARKTLTCGRQILPSPQHVESSLWLRGSLN